MCCGESRSPEKCAGCSFFKDTSADKNYRKVPYYTTREMAESHEKERIAHVIEATLSYMWKANKANINDRTARRLVEILLDKYHFNDADEAEPQIDDPTLSTAYQHLCTRIDEELEQVPAEQLVKALGAIYRSIQRRSAGSCSYLQFISRFAG